MSLGVGLEVTGLCLVALLVVYAAFMGLLILRGRRTDARALARFVPDCIVLMRRLLADPRLSRRRKLPLALLVVYLLTPFDLVPDFIPVAGQLDDAILVALVLRGLLRGAGEPLLREHWPGPERTLSALLWLAGAGGRQGDGGHSTAPTDTALRS